MIDYATKLAAAVAVVVGIALPAQAATVTFGPTPLAALLNPTATSITGAVEENTFGSVSGVKRSPWQGTSVDENLSTSYYTSICGGCSATYSLGMSDALSFFWGSPDGYNNLDIILSGGGGTTTVNGAAAQGPVSIGAQFVTISDVGLFDTITFRSSSNAFEFANLAATPVPVPASLPLMAGALAGFGLLRRHRRTKA